jgi:hypothetical protein
MSTNVREIKIQQFLRAAECFRTASAIEVDTAILNALPMNSPSWIATLLRALVDDATDDAGMFSLIHTAEAFGDDLYIEGFIAVIPDLVRTAPRWASILLMRVINSESAKAYLIKTLLLQSADTVDSVVWLCDAIGRRGRDLDVRVEPVRMAGRLALESGAAH